MAAAHYLTEGANAGRYEVTLYQRGWRLGGKGASGRNADHNERIEEHGLHIWLGFYENAFRLYRDVFDEWQRPPGHPWNDWNGGAFKKFSYTPLFEQREDGGWDWWNLTWPENNKLPGDGDTFSLWSMIHQIRRFLKQFSRGARKHAGHAPLFPVDEEIDDDFYASLQQLLGDIGDGHPAITLDAHLQIEGLNHAATTFFGFNDDIADTEDNRNKVTALVALCDHTIATLRKEEVSFTGGLRKLRIALEFGLVLLRGLFWHAWDILRHNLDVLDKYEFREFLARHGGGSDLLNSALVLAWYDLVFAFPQGDWEKAPNCAAGVTIRGYYRLSFTYKGGVFWKMQAGMGDTIFTPIYEVLKARGVRFRFFHDVRELIPHTGGELIDKVRIQPQATVIDGDYDPLVRVKNLDCWPDRPLYRQLKEAQQLEQGDELPGGGYDLESDFTRWDPQLPEISLKFLAVDDPESGIYGFEHLLFGLSVGSIQTTCSRLLAMDPMMAAMEQHLKTVRTQAYQLWMNRDLAATGWPEASPIGTHFENPLNTWADMTHLISREDYPAGSEPALLSYFCGPMKDDAPPNSAVDLLRKARARVAQNSVGLRQSLLGIWPQLQDRNGGFDPTAIMEEFVKANISGSDRYVLSVAGSTEYRLRADGTRFRNLTLVGDWTRNNFNAGCIEAAVMSGMQASHAISKHPPLDTIVGNNGP